MGVLLVLRSFNLFQNFVTSFIYIYLTLLPVRLKILVLSELRVLIIPCYGLVI
jgi:hypothetical protein